MKYVDLKIFSLFILIRLIKNLTNFEIDMST